MTRELEQILLVHTHTGNGSNGMLAVRWSITLVVLMFQDQL
jgi:hypothetical protein